MFIERVLDRPSYGYTRDGLFYKPTNAEILREFFRNLNIFSDRRNWLSLFSWVTTFSFAIPLAIFFTHYFSFLGVLIGFVYSMVLLGSHGTFWLHRYTTHRAFRFTNSVTRFLCRNLVIKIVPEEVYAISHHVHHHLSELPGDPYNAHGGFLYCFLADVTHQRLARDLSEREYKQVCMLLEHSGMRLNSYEQYKKWGSACHPVWTTLHFALNWAFWYGAFYLLGGHALAVTIFGASGVWAIGIRTFNYEGHGRGRDLRKAGSDFNTSDLSVNQKWPGIVAGEWHNNHHLYPNGARSGFLPHQIDFPWYFIWTLERLGQVDAVRDPKADFMAKHYLPYLEQVKAGTAPAPGTALATQN